MATVAFRYPIYFSVTPTGDISGAIVEVTNTYKEKHVYSVIGPDHPNFIECTHPKEFHVSPFLNDSGTYLFKIGKRLNSIDIHIRYMENDETMLYANLIQKEAREMNDKSMVTTAFRYPLGILGTMPRIIKEAAKLAFFKRLPASSKPVPHHANTIRNLPPTYFDTVWIAIVARAIRRIKTGRLVMILPDGSRMVAGDDTSPEGIIRINDYSFFKTLVLKGEIGFGESYVDGLWDTDNLLPVFSVFIRNKSKLTPVTMGTTILKWAAQAGHFKKRNTVTNSSRNIQAHYDLSNKMYSQFLDKGMNYSSAYFNSKSESLEQAQLNKLDRLIDRLHVLPHHHVLEIGSGWGSAAIRIAQRTDCKVTTLTLSQAQYDVVIGKIESLGLQDRITVLLEDYRNHRGMYDRILSIEMIEAVGHDYLPTYFKTIDTLLKPNGIVVLQAITVPDHRYDRYRSRVDWIQKHIFPGGHLPSVAKIQSILLSDTSFGIEFLENIGPHYATTLSEWRRRFLENESIVRELGFGNEFIRKWVYYLSYCEAGFADRYINTVQMVLTRPVNLDLIQEDHQ